MSDPEPRPPLPPCDLSMPHQMLGALVPREPFDGAGCPPQCPRRLAWEARARVRAGGELERIVSSEDVAELARRSGRVDEVLGLPVRVDASLDEDEVEIRRPDGSVVARARLRTHAEVRAARVIATGGLTLAPRLAEAAGPDAEAFVGQVVCDAPYPGWRAASGQPYRCMRPLGHRPPHAHIDLESLDAMPMRTWRGVDERWPA